MRIRMIETERLILRDIKEADAKDAYEIKNDKVVQEYSPDFLIFLPTYEDIKEYFYEKENYISIGGGFNDIYAVCLKESGELIGFIEIYDSPDFDETQISWHFSSKHAGKGFASEASAAIAEYLFNRLNLDCICATMDINNVASYKTAEKSGFKLARKFEYWRAQSGEVYYYMKQNTNAANIRKSA